MILAVGNTMQTKILQEQGMPKAIKEASLERVKFEVDLQGCRIQEIANNNFNQILRGVYEHPPKKIVRIHWT